MNMNALTNRNAVFDNQGSSKEKVSQGSFDSVDYIKQQSLLAQYKFGGKLAPKLPNFNLIDSQFGRRASIMSDVPSQVTPLPQ